MTAEHYSYGLTMTEIQASFSRDHQKGDYLIALMAGVCGKDKDGNYISSIPMARAVMDDFGSLVLVRGWL